MHRALEGCVLPQRRRELTFRGLMEDTFDAILTHLSEESEHRRYLEDLRARVSMRASRSANVLPERELAGMDLLVLLRQAYMLGHDARRTRVGSLGTSWLRARRGVKMDGLRQLDAQLFGTRVEQGW